MTWTDWIAVATLIIAFGLISRALSLAERWIDLNEARRPPPERKPKAE